MKFIFSAAIALAVAAVAYGAAASLIITNNPVAQQGSDGDLQCDYDGVQLFINETDGGPNANVDSVTVAGIDADCIGSGIRVQLTINGAFAAEVNGTYTGAPVNFVADFPNSGAGSVSFALVNDVHVQFSGASAGP